jgi:hypothetical protein
MKSKNKFLTLKVAKNLNVDSLQLSKGDKIKALFIVSQTNYYGTYDVYVNKYKKLMGLNTLQLDNIFNTLVDAGIIKLVKAGKYKEQCRTYAMVTPFNVETDDCEVVSFQFEAPGVPTFINRFIADGFAYKDNSTYKPRERIKENTPVLDTVMNALKARIKLLEEHLTANGITLPPDAENASNMDITLKEEPKIKSVDTTVKEASELIPVQLVVADESMAEGEWIKLTDHLMVLPTDTQLVMSLKDEDCYIDNHNLMRGWISELDHTEKVNLYSSIINEKRGLFTIPVTNKVKATFLKVLEQGYNKVLYKDLLVA